MQISTVSNAAASRRGPVLWRDDTDVCASCGSPAKLERSARFGEIPFCRECLDRSFRVSEWDDLGDPVG